VIYRVHNYVVTFRFLEMKGDKFLDPVNDVSVDGGKALRYLSECVKELTYFYGFKGSDVQIYGM